MLFKRRLAAHAFCVMLALATGYADDKSHGPSFANILEVESDQSGTTITVYSNNAEGDFTPAITPMSHKESWVAVVKGKVYPAHDVLHVDSVTRSIIIRWEPPLKIAGKPSPDALLVRYQPPGQNPVEIISNKKKAESKSWKESLFSFSASEDKKKADIDLSGSIQAGVGARPQYFWSAQAAYPIYLPGDFGSLAPSFKGQASQETNADPDSMKASAAYNKRIPILSSSASHPVQGFLISVEPVGYEFERTAKQEAVLVNGVAKLRKYQEKNTNLIWTGLVGYSNDWRVMNFVVDAGFEAGKELSRSVRSTGTTTGTNLNPKRIKVDAELGRFLFVHADKAGTYRPWLTFDGRYTLRLPFTKEPFKQAGVNDGNEFLTTKPRHYIDANFTIPFVKGAGLSIEYKFGSLPPTFSFVDHQVTVGLEIMLQKKR